MENLDIILLSTVVSVLFLVFIIATYREFAEMGKTPYKGSIEKGPRAEMMRYIGKIFSDDSIDPKQKEELIAIVKKSIDQLPIDEKN